MKNVILHAGTRLHLYAPYTAVEIDKDNDIEDYSVVEDSDATLLKDMQSGDKTLFVSIDHAGAQKNWQAWVPVECCEPSEKDFAIISTEERIKTCPFRVAEMYTAKCAIAKKRASCEDHPYDYNRYCSCADCPLGVPAKANDMADHSHIDFFLLDEHLSYEDCYLIDLKQDAGKVFIASRIEREYPFSI